jgi:hypothetical protein
MLAAPRSDAPHKDLTLASLISIPQWDSDLRCLRRLCNA